MSLTSFSVNFLLRQGVLKNQDRSVHKRTRLSVRTSITTQQRSITEFSVDLWLIRGGLKICDRSVRAGTRLNKFLTNKAVATNSR